MKDKRNLAALWAIVFFALATVMSSAAHASCSLANVAGSYGYTTSGFVATPTGAFVPVSAAGRIVFDRDGNVSGTQTRVVAGSSLDETYSGTYSVNADCTGSFTVLRTRLDAAIKALTTLGSTSSRTRTGHIMSAAARRHG
jgi:hypothetical protein